MNSRYYEPTTGRFITQDTYTGNSYKPWTQHLYSYCGNNPTNFIDPTGHRPVEFAMNGRDAKNERWRLKRDGSWEQYEPIIYEVEKREQFYEELDQLYEEYSVDTFIGLFGSVVTENTGIIYLRTDLDTHGEYVGQAKNLFRYAARQAEHARANPNARFKFEILRKKVPLSLLRQAEQEEIDSRGGPTNKSNPNGGLDNKRNEIAKSKYNTIKSEVCVKEPWIFGNLGLCVYGYMPREYWEERGIDCDTFLMPGVPYVAPAPAPAPFGVPLPCF